ncbi:hypothetical protein V6N13_027004 [Hibiscus sabdariffa]|uniref:Uncharacterized protein n=1 Tax=Hibiscus sabdariffa TaxID=183260 RepID=A0ABR2N9W5_9ROSI
MGDLRLSMKMRNRPVLNESSGHPYMWAHVLWPQEPRFGWTMQMSKCFQRGSGQCFRFTEATTDDWTYRAVSNIIAKQLLAPEEKCRPAYEMLLVAIFTLHRYILMDAEFTRS